METKHTCGPWNYLIGENTHGIHAGDDGYVNIAQVNAWRGHGNESNEANEAKANARLIAAAPELLDALRLVVDTAEIGVWAGATIVLAKGAIEKATTSPLKANTGINATANAVRVE